MKELKKAREENQKIVENLRIRDIRDKTRDLLDKTEYQSLPKIAKDLILKNPVSLSTAETIEEAMIDIEEFIATQAIEYKALAQPNKNQEGGFSQPNPTGHETPPVINQGNPAPVSTAGDEDVSNLSGSAKSRAMIRNMLRKAKTGR